MKNDKCTVLNFTERLGGKWKLPIINAIRKNETLRFGKIHQIVDGISRKVLTEQLKALEYDGLIIRRQYEEIPPRVEYSLTNKSRGLCEVFQAIDKWSHLEDK